MDSHRWAFFGTGGARPTVLLWNGQESRVVAPCKPGQSAYRVAVSPEGRRVLVGTRNREAADQFAPVLVYERGPDGGLEEGPARSWFQPSFVTGLAALTEELFVSSGYDGQVHVWSFAQGNKALVSLSASPAPVLALAPLSATLFATTSADGYLRLWDAHLAGVVREISLPAGGPWSGGLLSLAAAPDHRVILSLSPGGRAALHDLDDDLALRAAQPSPEPASAAEVVGDWVVLADATSPRLVARRLPDLQEQRLVPLELLVYALVAVADDSFVSIHKDGTGTLWSLGDRLEAAAVLDAGNLRCGHGPPRRAQLEIGRKAREDNRREELGRALELLRSGQHERLRFELDHLSLKGMGLESLLLLAESYRTQGRPLWELRARLALAVELDSTPEHAVHFFTLGKLLEELGEPGKARSVYGKVLAADPSRADASARMEALVDKEGPSALSPEVVRDDLARGDEVFLQEVEKMAALGIPWSWRATVRMGESETPFAAALGDVEHLTSHLGAELWKPEDVRLLARDGEVRETRWVSRTVDAGGRGGWTVTVEPLREERRVRLAFRLLFEPEEKSTVEETALWILGRMRDLKSTVDQSDFFRRIRAEVETQAKKAITSGGADKMF